MGKVIKFFVVFASRSKYKRKVLQLYRKGMKVRILDGEIIFVIVKEASEIVVLKPNAIESSTCIMVNIRRLIPGTRRKIIQYHGLSIILRMAKLFKPGM